MKIYVYGHEMELDDTVAYAAYVEMQHKFDMEEVEYRLRDILEDLRPSERNAILDNSELISEIADRYRRYLNNQDTGDLEWDCVKDVYDQVMAERGE